ncbi:hypothetical protein FRAHR75_1120015 [Frankia sp. Hr75.2]|nr:hypothetical protein FRAHR75_1120015 [Frankia sp. Hr75.2]
MVDHVLHGPLCARRRPGQVFRPHSRHDLRGVDAGLAVQVYSGGRRHTHLLHMIVI